MTKKTIKDKRLIIAAISIIRENYENRGNNFLRNAINRYDPSQERGNYETSQTDSRKNQNAEIL